MVLETLNLKPGTVLLIFFIAVFGLFVFNWSSGSIQDTGEEALEDQRSAIDCSNLEIDFVQFNSFNGSTQLLFRLNQDVETADIGFRGSQNDSVRIENINETDLNRAVVNGTGFDNVVVRTGECGQGFSYR